MKLKYKDSIHAYYLTIDDDDAEAWGAVAGNGIRCKSVTAIAKIPDDGYALDQWRKRQVAIGLARAPHLLESVAAHFEDKAKVNDLCEQAMTAAGADQASERGTTAHRITELVDRGDNMIETALSRSVAERWRALLDTAGIEIIADFVERVVIYPRERICGKFDRLGLVLPGGTVAAEHPESVGKLITLDLKTGAGAVRYPHSTAIQLATYAYAPLVADLWDGIDGETTAFAHLPENLDRSFGLVIQMTDDVSEVWEIDLKLGYRALQTLVFPTLRWRAIPNGDVIRKVAELV